VIWNTGEVGPGVVVEEVAPHAGEDPFGAEYRHWLIAGPKRILDQERKSIGVIHMGVRDQNVANLSLLFDRQSARDGAGVDRDLTIDQKSGLSPPKLPRTRNSMLRV
jgi:hypothetical protein